MLDKMPSKILREIYAFLPPEAIGNVQQTSKPLHQAVNKDYWQRKYLTHFPYLYHSISKKKPNWSVEFKKTYITEYSGLSLTERKIFSAVKESHLDDLKEKESKLKKLLINTKKDGSKTTLLNWVLKIKNQTILNYCYDIMKSTYLTPYDTIDTQKQDKKNRTILYWAIIFQQNIETINNLLFEQGSLLDELYDQNKRPIHLAAIHGHLPVVKAFIKMDPKLLHAGDEYGQTPLLWAAKNGHLEIVKYLLSQGANRDVFTNSPTISSCHNTTALFWAIYDGHTDVALQLIEADCDIVKASGDEQSQPIHIAAEKGNIDLLKALLKKNPALIDTPNAEGGTPLMLAIAQHPAVAIFLMEAGADTSKIPKKLKFKLVHMSVKKGNVDLVKSLLEKDSTLLEVTDLFGQTPLLWAAATGQLDMLKYLIAQGAQLDVFTLAPEEKEHNKTPLCWAIENDNTYVALHLIEAGSDITKRSGKQQAQSIHIAAKKGNMDLVKALLEKDPMLLNAEDSNGRTPLMWAAKHNRTDVALYLITIEASTIKPSTNEKMQPIHFAAIKGNLTLVKALIDKNPAVLDATDINDHTPLLCAAAQGHHEMVTYLIEKGAKLDVFSHAPNEKYHKRKLKQWAIHNGHHAIAHLLTFAELKATITSYKKCLRQIEEIESNTFAQRDNDALQKRRDTLNDLEIAIHQENSLTPKLKEKVRECMQILQHNKPRWQELSLINKILDIITLGLHALHRYNTFKPAAVEKAFQTLAEDTKI